MTYIVRLRPGAGGGAGGLFPNAPTAPGWTTRAQVDEWPSRPRVAFPLYESPNATGLYMQGTTWDDKHDFIDVAGQSFTKAQRIIFPASEVNSIGMFPEGTVGTPFRWAAYNAPEGTAADIYLGMYVRFGGTPRFSKGSRADVPGTGGRSGGFKWGYFGGLGTQWTPDFSCFAHALLGEGSQETEPMYPSLLLQPNGAVPGHAGSRQYGVGTTDIGASSSGTWHLLECLIVGNTKTGGVPNADGVVRWYVGGVQQYQTTSAIIYDVNIPRGTTYWEFAPINGVSAAPWERTIDYGPIRIITRDVP